MNASYPIRPIPAVACLVIKDKRVLTILRGKPPSENFWSLPGGKIELGEKLLDAAKREVFEETRIIVEPISPFAAIDAIYYDKTNKIIFHYVIIYVSAQYLEGEILPDDDVLDAKWMSLQDMEKTNFEPKTLEIVKKYINLSTYKFR